MARLGFTHLAIARLGFTHRALARLGFTHLLFLTIICLLLGCSHSSHLTAKPVFRLHGTKTCRFVDPLFFVLKDLSCNRIPAYTKNTHYKSDNKPLSAVTSLAILAKWDICNNTHIRTESHLELYKDTTSAPDLLLFQNHRDIILHQACEEGRLAVVKYVLSHGIVDINCRGKQGRTPVMAAVRTGQASVFDFLVRKSCNLVAVDDNNDNVLHVACEGGHADLVRKLVVGEKIDIESRGNYGDTPLLKTAYYGHRTVLEFLVNKGCNLKVVDTDGDNVLHVASEGGHVDMVKHIVSMNIVGKESKGYRGRTPVMQAACYGQEKVFEFLVNKGCNLKVVDTQGSNVLHIACYSGNAEMVKYIVSKNIVGLESKDHRGRTPVMEAARYGQRKAFEFLLNKGCNLKVVDINGNNVLHRACRGGHAGMVTYLMTLPAVEGIEKARNEHGRTPIQEAEYYHHTSVINILKHGS